MKMLFLANWSDGSYVFFSIIVIILIVGATYILFRSFLKERVKYRVELTELMEGVMKKNEIMSTITNYINRSPSSLSFSVLLIDFDKYGDLVNAFGLSNSKKVLEESIKNIKKVFPNSAVIGRIADDEFLVLVKEEYDKSEVLRFANRIKEAATEGVKIYTDTLVYPTVSIGVAFYPNHGRSVKRLLKSLELAVFNCKNQGGNKAALYSDEYDRNDAENLQLYYEIKEAINDNQFKLFYQPIIDIEKNEIYGFEALLRWKHPTLGILSPGSFINILEQSGDINAVGVKGIEELIKDHIELKKKFVHQNIQLSFNLSPKQLISETLGVTFQRIIKKYKVPIESITIEIVEFAMFEKHETIFNNIQNLKKLGFKVAVDGVGLDQNTLNKLGNSPIDIIKLDKTFFDADDSYVQSKYIDLLIGFAKNTGKTIICEGVETVELLKKIKEHGISYVQGYLFSKPFPKEELHDYILNYKNNSSDMLKMFDENEEENLIEEE